MKNIQPELTDSLAKLVPQSTNRQSIVISDANPILSDSMRRIFLDDPNLAHFEIIPDSTCVISNLLILDPDILIIDPLDYMSSQGALLEDFQCLTGTTSVIGYCPKISPKEARELSLAGFRGILPKTVSSDELVRIVCSVVFGGVYLHEIYTLNSTAADADADDASARSSGLTDREIEVLRHVALGCSMKEIAALLNISAKTVDTYKTRANQKLNLRTRTEIVRYAIDSGWLN